MDDHLIPEEPLFKDVSEIFGGTDPTRTLVNPSVVGWVTVTKTYADNGATRHARVQVFANSGSKMYEHVDVASNREQKAIDASDKRIKDLLSALTG